MHFLPTVYVKCDVCAGKRFNRETLEVKWNEKSIYDVLDMTVEEAAKLAISAGLVIPPFKDPADAKAHVEKAVEARREGHG